MSSVTLNRSSAQQHIEPVPLNKYVTEVPHRNFFILKCKAITLKALAIIAAVAFVLILAAAFSGMSATGGPSMMMVGLILFSPLLAHIAAKLVIWGSNYSQRAAVEGRITLHLKRLMDDHWDTDPTKIQQFFREQGLDISRVPLEALRRINAANPLAALLPLIARFHFLKEISEIAAQDFDTMFRSPPPVEETDPARAILRRNLRLEARSLAWTSHESVVIPKALEAALLLHLIQTPTLVDLTLGGIGELRVKNYAERMFDRTYAPVNDDYFVFHQNLHRQPLTLREVETDLAPRALRLKLFPYA